MANIQLEFESLIIDRPKKRWKLYFVLVTEHPEENDKMVVGYVPQTGLEPFIRLKPRMDNRLDFETGDVGADGLQIMERTMPQDRSLMCRVFLRHSRKSTRNAGEFISTLQDELGDHVLGTAAELLGMTASWLIITKAALPLVGGAIKKIKDRDFGMLSLDEDFGSEFDNQEELDRHGKFSTGDAQLVWSWSVK